MADPTSGTASPVRPSDDRLDSWKEIAAYLSRDVTTVQRWEKREGMPVHRHLHDRIGSVYASRAELDAWSQTRNSPRARDNGNDVTSSGVHAPAAPVRSRLTWKIVLPAAAFAVALAAGMGVWLQKTEYFWSSPLAKARFQTITEFDGVQQEAALSRDGNLLAFLSDRDGQNDVWITQVGSGQFHNLTRGSAPELVNPSVRTLGFSPDASLVTFWTRKRESGAEDNISTWAVPTLGGLPKPYLDGVAEFDWSRDGRRLVYHTPAPGDPMFVSDGVRRTNDRALFKAPAGFHAHFLTWSPDSKFIYFVQGTLPDKLDIWRIRPTGGTPERMTFHNGNVSHPVLLNSATLMYLATDRDGSGPWLYGMDVERRIPHRLNFGPERYTSLAADADGRRLVVTLASPKRTLWRVRTEEPFTKLSAPIPISLTSGTGFSPRLAASYLLYVSSADSGDSIWKLANGAGTQLWTGEDTRVLGAPAISRDEKQIAFSVRRHTKTFLYVMQADGTKARTIADSLDVEGPPAWAPDGQSLLCAANEHGPPHLVRVPLDGRSPSVFISEYSVGPAWSPDSRLILYSGPDAGATFSVKAVTENGIAQAVPPLVLTRGARHLVFLPGGRALVVLRGEIQHKNLWLIDLATGAEHQLTTLPADFDVSDFDISPDGRELVLERLQERSEVVLVERPQS